MYNKNADIDDKYAVLSSICRKYFSELSLINPIYLSLKPEIYINSYFESKNSYIDILYSGNEPVGFISWRTTEKPIFGVSLFIDDIYVLPEKRRKKTAFSAVKKLFSVSSEIGIYVLPDNYSAMRFWNTFTQKTRTETSDGMIFLTVIL